MQTTPDIVIMDEFLQDPGAYRDEALQKTYAESDYHKGRRSTDRYLSAQMKLQFEDLLRRKIVNWEEHEMNGKFQYCIAGDQIVFHSDGQTHAGIVYLTPDAPLMAGTSFWKSKANGARRPPATEEECIVTYGGKLLDSTAWDLVDTVGNVYNRLVLWDGKLIHSASAYFGTDIQNGRLFQIFFFDTEGD